MPTNPIGVSGKKSGIYIRVDGETEWQEIVGAKSFDLPDGEVSEIDVTWLGSDNVETIPGNEDLGTITIPVIWDMGSDIDVLLASLSHDVPAGEKRPNFDIGFRVKRQDGTFATKGARGWIKNYKCSVAGNSEANTSELTIRLVGRMATAPTITVA